MFKSILTIAILAALFTSSFAQVRDCSKITYEDKDTGEVFDDPCLSNTECTAYLECERLNDPEPLINDDPENEQHYCAAIASALGALEVVEQKTKVCKPTGLADVTLADVGCGADCLKALKSDADGSTSFKDQYALGDQTYFHTPERLSVDTVAAIDAGNFGTVDTDTSVQRALFLGYDLFKYAIENAQYATANGLPITDGDAESILSKLIGYAAEDTNACHKEISAQHQRFRENIIASAVLLSNADVIKGYALISKTYLDGGVMQFLSSLKADETAQIRLSEKQQKDLCAGLVQAVRESTSVEIANIKSALDEKRSEEEEGANIGRKDLTNLNNFVEATLTRIRDNSDDGSSCAQTVKDLVAEAEVTLEAVQSLANSAKEVSTDAGKRNCDQKIKQEILLAGYLNLEMLS